MLSLLMFTNSKGQVNGNGSYQSKTFDLSEFDQIEITFPAKVEINTNRNQNIEINTDENIFNYLKVAVEDKRLIIDQIEWIEPSNKAAITISLPYLDYLKTGGYGVYSINVEDGKNITVDNPVATLTMMGTTETLTYSSNTGKLFAEDLITNDVEVNIMSFGIARLQAKNSIKGILMGRGTISYLYKPETLTIRNGQGGNVFSIEDEKQFETRKRDVKYVNIKLHNNKLKRIHTRIEGPIESPFGYGAPFNPLQKRKERFPIGTKIYRKGLLGTETLLYEVSESDDGKTVKLF